jgi:hypothetical protein
MIVATAVALVTATISGKLLAAELPLPRPMIESGLSRAGCEVAPGQAKLVGSEWLGRLLRIVEVSCSPAVPGKGSVLFAVPLGRPADGQLIMLQDWRHGRVVPAYRVVSPGYDRETRTLSSVRQSRRAGDCGTIKEWKWTGYFFRLIHVWSKNDCDGEGFEWDNRHRWQVFPQPNATPDQRPSGFNGPSVEKCPPRCSHQSSTRLGSPAAEQIAKKAGQPAAAATNPAPDDR